MATVSARPDRLVRFDETLQAACDGMHRRLGALEDALATYVATCDAAYVVDCRDSVDAIDAWGRDYRSFGRWTADVGRAFEEADGGVVADHMPSSYADPYLGVPPSTGSAGPIAGDQDGPPQWLETLQQGGDLAGISKELIKGYAGLLAELPESVTVSVRITNGTVEVLSDGAVVARYTELEVRARLVTPRAGPGLTSATKWLGRASNVLSFATGFAEQYRSDTGLPTDERLLRATTKGGGILAGAAVGGTTGLLCGPGAPVCSTVLAIGGGIVGGLGGGWLADQMPWMDDPEPGEHDLGVIEDVVADPTAGEGLSAEAISSVDTLAEEIALADTEGRPELHEQVEREILADVNPALAALLDPTGFAVPPPSPPASDLEELFRPQALVGSGGPGPREGP